MSFLKGKKVRVYTVGSFVFTGVILDKNEQFLILKGHRGYDPSAYDGSNTDIYLFNEKIVSFQLINKTSEEKRTLEKPIKNSIKEKYENNFPQNDLSYNENYASLPESLLQKPIENEDVFSVFFGSKNNNGRVTFSTGSKDENE